MPWGLSNKGLRTCRGLVRSREEDILGEMEDSPEHGSQSRQVRQRQNPEKISELTSIKELLQEVAQDTHDGRQQTKAEESCLLCLPLLHVCGAPASAGTPCSRSKAGDGLLSYSMEQCQFHAAH